MEDLTKIIVILAAIGVVSIYVGIKTFFKQKIFCGLHEAVRNGRYEKIMERIEQCEDVNSNDQQNGYTPLHYAILNKDYKAAVILIENGARLCIKSPQGKTAIDLAQPNEYGKIKNILSLEGKEIRLTKDSRTPLHLAAEAGDIELSEFIIRKGL